MGATVRRREPLGDLHVRLVLLLELTRLLPDCPLMARLAAYLDGDDDRRLTQFYNSKLESHVRHVVDAISQAVSHLQHLDPGISLATLPSLVGRLCVSAPVKVAVVRDGSAPSVLPRPSLPADVRKRHLLIGNEIAWALDPLRPLLPDSARQIWPRHRPIEDVPRNKSSRRSLKGARRVAGPLRAKIEKWMWLIRETLEAAAGPLAMPIEDLMGIDQIARIPEHLNGQEDAFAVPVFRGRQTVDGEPTSPIRIAYSSRRIRVRRSDCLSRVCEGVW